MQRFLEGGEHLVALRVEVGELVDQLLANPFRGERCRHIEVAPKDSGGNRRVEGRTVLAFGDRLLITHAIEHQVAAPQCAFRSVDRIAGAGCLGDAGQHGKLRKG